MDDDRFRVCHLRDAVSLYLWKMTLDEADIVPAFLLFAVAIPQQVSFVPLLGGVVGSAR